MTHSAKNNLNLRIKTRPIIRLEQMQRFIYLAFVNINLAQKPGIFRFHLHALAVTGSVFMPRFRLFCDSNFGYTVYTLAREYLNLSVSSTSNVILLYLYHIECTICRQLHYSVILCRVRLYRRKKQ